MFLVRLYVIRNWLIRYEPVGGWVTMIKKLISAGIFLLAFSQGSNAAIVEGDGFVSSGLRISSITGAVNDLSLIGATQISQQTDFVFAAGSFTNNLAPVQPFGAIGIGDILETTIDVDTQVDGPVGGVFSTVTMSALLAVTNVSSTAQSFVLDVFSNMDVNASDGFGAAQASGFSGFCS